MDIVRQNHPRRRFDMIGITAEAPQLTTYLKQALGQEIVFEQARIVGEPYSIRLLLTHYRPGIPWAKPVGISEVASNLMLLRDIGHPPARYDPQEKEGYIKAMLVEEVEFQNKRAALVSATWLAA